MTLAERLRADRLTRLMTWADYANFLGVSTAAIFAIVAGREPSELTLAKIEAKLQQTPREREKASPK